MSFKTQNKHHKKNINWTPRTKIHKVERKITYIGPTRCKFYEILFFHIHIVLQYHPKCCQIHKCDPDSIMHKFDPDSKYTF